LARVAEKLAPGIICREITPGLLDQVFSTEAVADSERGPRSAASLHRMKAAVRSFFAWAVEAGVVDDNPARSIRMHRLPRKLPVFLTAAEKKRLLKELKGWTDFSALRDRAMIEVLLGTGIRLGELAALDMDDIDLDAKHLRVWAKGNVPQVKFIKTDLRTLLRRYLAERRRRGRPEMEALFLSNRDSRLCQRQIANRLAHWLRKAGDRKGTDAARHAAHFRHPPLRRDQRPARGATGLGAPGRVNHSDLHPPRGRPARGSPRTPLIFSQSMMGAALAAPVFVGRDSVEDSE